MGLLIIAVSVALASATYAQTTVFDDGYKVRCSKFSECDIRHQFCELKVCHDCAEECPPHVLSSLTKKEFCRQQCSLYLEQTKELGSSEGSSETEPKPEKLTDENAPGQGNQIALHIVVPILACVVVVVVAVVGVSGYIRKNRNTEPREESNTSTDGDSSQGASGDFENELEENSALSPCVIVDSTAVGGPVRTCTDDVKRSLFHNRQLGRPTSEDTDDEDETPPKTSLLSQPQTSQL